MINHHASNDSAEHRLFRTDAKLSSDEINDLLGIRVSLDYDQKFAEAQNSELYCNRLLHFTIAMLLLVAFALLGSMYQLKIGPFYESKVIALTASLQTGTLVK